MREAVPMCDVIYHQHLFQWTSADKSPLTRQHTPSLFILEWLNRRGLLSAGVTRTGCLVLASGDYVPANIMNELREASYIYYVNAAGEPIGDKVMLSAWLKNGVDSEDLQCSQRNGLSVPISTLVIKLCLMLREGRSVVLCDMAVVRDDRKDPRVHKGG